MKVARGTQKKCRLNTAEPTYSAPNDLAPPHGLTGRGKQEWTARIGDAVKLGVVTVADLPTLHLYCQLLTDLEWISVRVAKAEGSDRLTYLREKNKMLTQFKALARELGFTPSSRSGVKADGEQEQKDNLAPFLRAVK
jgi:phage terminase small subunit